MKTLTMAILVLNLLAGMAIAAGKPPQDKPVTHNIADYDPNFASYTIQSDGLGPYTHTFRTSKGKSTGTTSVLMTNVCGGLTYGDRLLDQSNDNSRTVKITFDSTNSIQPGDPNYLLPPQFFGTFDGTVRNMNKCTCGTGQNMYTMAAETKIYCPMHFVLHSENYRLDMGTAGEPETEFVQITCNATDAAGCKDWSIDPISDPEDTTNPGRTRARLVNLSNGQNLGNYYMTFHLHVTRP